MSAPALLAVRRRARRSRPGGPRGVARRRRPRASRRARRGGGALPRLQRQAGLGRGPAAGPCSIAACGSGSGTDGPASNDDLHLWDEMRLAALLARATAATPARSPRRRRCAWPPAAAARPSASRSARSRSGRPADVIRLRTDDPRFTPSVDRRRAAGAPGVGGGGLSGDRRVGGWRVRRRGGPLHPDRRRPGPCRGGAARPPTARLLSFPPCPDSSTRPSCTRAPATGAPARCRGGARRTSTGAVPTAATGGTAATSGSWRRSTSRRCSASATTRSAAPPTACTARARSGTAPAARTSWCRCPSARWCATSDGRVVVRPGDRGCPLPGGRGRAGRARQRAVPLQPAPGARLRRAGREGPGALARHGAQADGRRGARRLPQRRQVDADLDRVGRQAEDRRLPLHDAGAASRRRARRAGCATAPSS